MSDCRTWLIWWCADSQFWSMLARLKATEHEDCHSTHFLFWKISLCLRGIFGLPKEDCHVRALFLTIYLKKKNNLVYVHKYLLVLHVRDVFICASTLLSSNFRGRFGTIWSRKSVKEWEINDEAMGHRATKGPWQKVKPAHCSEEPTSNPLGRTLLQLKIAISFYDWETLS